MDGTEQAVHVAVIGLSTSARSLIDAAARCGDEAAYRLAVDTFAAAADFIGARGLTDEEEEDDLLPAA